MHIQSDGLLVTNMYMAVRLHKRVKVNQNVLVNKLKCIDVYTVIECCKLNVMFIRPIGRNVMVHAVRPSKLSVRPSCPSVQAVRPSKLSIRQILVKTTRHTVLSG